MLVFERTNPYLGKDIDVRFGMPTDGKSLSAQ